jgi:protein gp37/ParB-like chromosome segregation protein Spo0J
MNGKVRAMTEFGGYKVHPVAAEFPLATGVEFDQLVADIKEHGLIEPIVLTSDGSTIIDGRNRWRACDAALVDPAFKRIGKHYTEMDIIAFIISRNVRRRSLDAGQRAIVAQKVAPALELAAKERQREGGKEAGRGRAKDVPNSGQPNRAPRVVDQLAAMFNVGHDSITRAKKIVESSRTLTKQILAGEKTLNEAYSEVRRKPKASSEAKPSKKKAVPMLTLKTHDGREVPYRAPEGKATFNRTNQQVDWSAWTWNPVTGCLHGCKYCYAREMAEMRPSYRAAYPVGFTPLFHHERLDAPKNTMVPKEAINDARLKRVFVCSMADLYGKWVPDEWIEQVHKSAKDNPQWDYLLLTKFPRRYVGLELPPTAWAGTSVDEQKRVRLAEEAFAQIKNVRVKWLSLEPLLAPLEFTDLSMFDWIVIGAQSATEQPDGFVKEQRPKLEWVARLLDQARECGCRVYCKPNLMGIPNSQSPGMDMPKEEPFLANGKDHQPAQAEMELTR